MVSSCLGKKVTGKKVMPVSGTTRDASRKKEEPGGRKGAHGGVIPG